MALMRLLCALAAATGLGAFAVASHVDVGVAEGSALDADLELISPSEVYICRKCGAVIARGVEYLPDSPQGKRLLSVISTPELGTNGKLLEFEHPFTTAKQRLALFRRSEPTV